MGLAALVLLSLLCIGTYAKTIPGPIFNQEISALEEYWTPERMASAIPPDYLNNNGDEKPLNIQEDTDYDPSVPASFTQGNPLGKDEEIINITSAFAYPFPYTSAYVGSASYTTYPYRAVGKVFFTTGGLNYVCSAGVVQKYIVYTAGHCVFNLATASWVTNFVFVPGYNNGNRPYGTFAAYQPWARTEYTTSPASNPARGYDVAVVILQKISGYGVGDYVGWFGAAWNFAYTQSWRSYGYPAASPFNGEWDYYCDAALGIQDTAYTPNTMGIGCDATGGCSGGPWILGSGGSTNQINSVNGYKYNAQPAALYGAYFGAAAQNLYTTAVAITPP